MANFRKKKKILLVEDNAVNLKTLSNILNEDYDLLISCNGKDALDCLKGEEGSQISAVILDLIMPVMDGYQVLKNMRSDERFKLIPVIVTSGEDGAENKEVLALSLGANDYVTKPYKPDILKHRILNAISARETLAFINTVQYDELTGIYSKEYFCHAVETVLMNAESKEYDLISCDIERFKMVNDLYGSTVGNAMLKYFAEGLKNDVGKNGIYGRLDGDQFAALIPHVEKYSKNFFDNIIDRMNNFNLSVRLSVNFGIYVIEDCKMPVWDICNRALIAGHSVKGKYDVHFAYYDEKLRSHLIFEQMILDNMKAAITLKQFEVHYQPKHALSDGSVAGAEALVRWIHPTLGYLSPAQFIPIFEKNGFIAELDFYVFETVCKYLSDSIKDGENILPISVNVSRIDIYNPRLADNLSELLKKYGVEPRWVHLEITETAYTENPDQLIAQVHKLKNLGFIIEMDDFGSGYSSLNMLSQLPLDILKLDMKFMQNNDQLDGKRSILSYVISLAKWLNLPIVAEGVETKEQLDALKSMDCTFVQGYYYSKPLPLEKYKKYLKETKISENKSYTKKDVALSLENPYVQAEKVMLIVDYSPNSLAELKKIFAESYHIHEECDGNATLKYIEENYRNIEVILLDLVMPVMDGFELLSSLKNNDKLKNIPVIVTSESSEESEVRALKCGAADFIGRPYNSEIAKHRVNNAVAESKLQAALNEKKLYVEVERMRFKAEHDSLTELYNRTALETHINTFFSYSKNSPACFIMIDIDNFKMINDVYGHDKGDDVLKEIAKILLGHFSGTDIVTRFGGDEFAIFLTDFTTQTALRKNINLLCKKLQLQFGGIEITATVGASLAPEQGTDYQTLYKKADTALLAAKRLGKNQYRFYDEDLEMPSPILTRNLDWLLDETSDGIVVCDAESYDILYINHVVCEMTDKTKRYACGKKCYEFLWNKDKPCEHCVSIDKMTGAYEDKEYIDKERGKSYIIKSKLSEWGGKQARIQYIQDNTSKAIAAKQLADISTDRKRLLDLMPGGIFRYKAADDDEFDFVSENMLKMLGYTYEAFMEKFQRHFKNMVWHEDRERVLKEIDAQIAKGSSDECEYRIEKADGSLCWVHDVGHWVKDDDGEALFYVTIMDVTKEHDAVKNLLEEKQKLRIALSHTKLKYWERDFKNNVAVSDKTGNYIDSNEKRDYSLEDCGIVPDEYIDVYKANEQALKNGAKSVEYDMPLYNADRKIGWWHISCTNIFDENGKPIKTIGTAEKIDRPKNYFDLIAVKGKREGE